MSIRVVHRALWVVLCAAGCGCVSGASLEIHDNDGTQSPAGVPGVDGSSGGASSVDHGGAASGGASTAGSDSVAGSGGKSGSDTGTAAIDPDLSRAALEALREYLALPRDERESLEELAFAKVALTRADAESARQLLWDDWAAFVRSSRVREVGATETLAKSVQASGVTLRYYQAVRGSLPEGGRSLIISMHGGGSVGREANDQQWANQIGLVNSYRPKDAIWIAPRAPIDDWDMWFRAPIDALFDRLIANALVFEKINPNKVYLTGYSAGGDGVYQLGTRMADRFAGAAMSAGHPNDARPENLRNVAFAIHVGGADTAFDRNLKAAEWGQLLEKLHAGDSAGYFNQWDVHEGLPHWMSMADAVSVPFIQGFTRNPVPRKVVWRGIGFPHRRSYWLAVDAAPQTRGACVEATYASQVITLLQAVGINSLRIRLSDAMLDLDQPVRIERAGQVLWNGKPARTIATLAATLAERSDPSAMFSASVEIRL